MKTPPANKILKVDLENKTIKQQVKDKSNDNSKKRVTDKASDTIRH